MRRSVDGYIHRYGIEAQTSHTRTTGSTCWKPRFVDLPSKSELQPEERFSMSGVVTERN
jgi:hypothetical protein